MADKDILGVVQTVKDQIDEWHITALPLPRAVDVDALFDILLKAGINRGKITKYEVAEKALAGARKNASNNDRIIAFGSFWVVTGVTPA